MRFRKSFGWTGWLFLLFLCSQAFFELNERHPSHWRVTFYIFLVLMVLHQALSRYLVWWDIDSDGLHQRHWRSKKEFAIAWDKILVVRNAIPGVT